MSRPRPGVGKRLPDWQPGGRYRPRPSSSGRTTDQARSAWSTASSSEVCSAAKAWPHFGTANGRSHVPRPVFGTGFMPEERCHDGFDPLPKGLEP
jgi:hypothetical protein